MKKLILLVPFLSFGLSVSSCIPLRIPMGKNSYFKADIGFFARPSISVSKTSGNARIPDPNQYNISVTGTKRHSENDVSRSFDNEAEKLCPRGYVGFGTPRSSYNPFEHKHQTYQVSGNITCTRPLP
jgi:hypothetical protein